MQAADGKYVDPDAWSTRALRHEGYWWPAFQEWIAAPSSEPVAPMPIGVLGGSPLKAIVDAPGTYVHED
jgi:polyhydroxyalkanoate synthase subunit PhaC